MLETFANPSNRYLLVSALAGLSAMTGFLAIALPIMEKREYAKRMKVVAAQREKQRGPDAPQKSLRPETNVHMKKVVDRFSLSKWLSTDDARLKLSSAGYRGPQAEIAFLFFRAVSPIAFLIGTIFYFYTIDPETDLTYKAGACLAALYAGVKAPEVFLKNAMTKRQASMRRAFPDALDLILVCVESGMSVEAAFRKVGQEIGVQSVELAEEFAFATAELNYLQDRRAAYVNLATRTGLPAVKQLVTVLIQAEKYGTPLGQALRVTAQESRDARMAEAEKLAAALPPKLTVPMILFFLPVLMLVVVAPAAIQIMQMS